MSKINLLGCDRKDLISFFIDLGEPIFRAQQLLQWVHKNGVLDFYSMHTLPKKLMAILDDTAILAPPTITEETCSKDGTVKWRVVPFGDSDGNHVEMVRIPHDGRVTLCISSQAGCAVNCSFCVTGKQGFGRDLSASDIIGQLWLAQHKLRSTETDPITNVVFMGMGEPLLNTEAVLSASNIMVDDLAYGLSKRKTTISTSGIVPAIYDLCGKTEVALAISLHAADDDLRTKLVPINKKYPIASLLKAARAYLASLSGKRFITFEYTLINGVNDSLKDAELLAKLLSSMACKINLIPYNESAQIAYKRPNIATINAFAAHLHRYNHIVTVRQSRGDDSAAACGQLAGNIVPRNKRIKAYL